MVDFWVPDESSGEIVTFDRLEAQSVRDGVARWRAAKGARRIPQSPDALLAAGNTLLIEVLDGGGDYYYRSVGEALRGSFGEDFSGRRLSDIIHTTPRFGLGLRMLYDMVRGGAEPLYYCGWVGQDLPDAQFVYHESALLPFGVDEALVDHIIVLSALVPRDRHYPPAPRKSQRV